MPVYMLQHSRIVRAGNAVFLYFKERYLLWLCVLPVKRIETPTEVTFHEETALSKSSDLLLIF